MIVKVQVPIATNDPSGGEALIYNEDRSIYTMLPLTDELLEAMDGEPKAFFHAHMEDTILHIDDVAPWQEW